MSNTSFTRKRGQPFELSPEERERLRSVTESQIQAGADSDADNPVLGEGDLRRMQTAREVRRIRERTGLSQPQFAALYGIGLGRLRDFEQARSEPDLLVRVFYRLIDEDPERAEGLVRAVESEFAP